MSEVLVPSAEVAKIHEQLVFEIIPRGNAKSGFMRKEDKGKSNPRYLNASRTMNLPMESRHFGGAGKGYVKTQYIFGADTIYVDDYVDADNIKQKGLKNQGYDLKAERERAVGMNIHFVFGQLDLRKYGADDVLVDFVNKHEMNAESPAGKNPNPIVNRMFQFRPLRKEEKAVKRTADFEDVYDAMSIVRKLRTKTKDGFDWDEPQIDAILNILGGKTADLGIGTTAQKFEMILAYATKDGAEFLNTINESLKETKLTIGKAITLDILKVTSKGAELKVGEGAEWRKIYEFAGALKEEQRIETLAIYLLGGNENSTNDFNLMFGEVEVAKLKDVKKK